MKQRVERRRINLVQELLEHLHICRCAPLVGCRVRRLRQAVRWEEGEKERNGYNQAFRKHGDVSLAAV